MKLYYKSESDLIKSITEKGIETASRFDEESHNKIVSLSKLEMSFDIETTKEDNTEKSYMYVGQFSIGGKYFSEHDFGFRSWEHVFEYIEYVDQAATKENCIVIIWIANLSYEMSFMLPWFDSEKLEVMADSPRKPIYVKYGNIEFRDTLRVSGMNLRNTAKNYCKTQKLELDYSVKRNSHTDLTEDEWNYNFNDTRICCEFYDFILSQTVEKGYKLPYTQTGILRQMVKNLARDDEFSKQVPLMFPKNELEYIDIMTVLFAGGDTHARCDLVNQVIDNVQCHDFESSYPARMLQNDNYPMSPFKRTNRFKTLTDIDHRNPQMTYWFDITLGVEAKHKHTYISKHKCKYIDPMTIIDNGKIYYSKKIRIYVTEMDLDCIKMLYKISDFKINRAFFAQKGRLPDYILKPLVEQGTKKAELKNQGLKDTPEYCSAKGLYNSGYGLMVQKLHLDEIKYENNSWILQSNTSYKKEVKKQYLSPFWGIWVTSNARYELIRCITSCEKLGSESVYNDTDSTYLHNPELCRSFVEEYNNEKREINKKIGLDMKYFKNLGTLDADPICTFKTLGAKRYIKEYSDEKGLHQVATVAGLPKKAYNKWLEKTGGDFWDSFNNGLMIDLYTSEKLCSKYTDTEYSGEITDYKGNTETMHEKSGVCLCEIPFEIKINDDWLKWAETIRIR